MPTMKTNGEGKSYWEVKKNEWFYYKASFRIS